MSSPSSSDPRRLASGWLPVLPALMLALVLLLVGAGQAVWAAGSQPIVVSPTAGTGAAQQAAAPTEADIDALVKKLQDPKARDELIASLRLLQTTQGQQAAPPPSVPEDLLTTLSTLIDERLSDIVGAADDIGSTFMQTPALFYWVRYQVENDTLRRYWGSVFLGLAWVFGAGALMWWLLRRLTRRWLTRIRLPPRRATGRVGVALLRLGLELMPVLGFALAATLVLRLQPLLAVTKAVGAILLVAVIFCRLLTALVWHLLRPDDTEGRLLPLGDDAARHLARWTIRIITVTVYGWALLRGAERLGLPDGLHTALSHVVFLTVAIMLTVFLIELRARIERLLHGLADGVGSSFLRQLVPWEPIATYGYVTLILLVWVHYLVWAVGLGGGFTYLLTATAATIVMFFAAQAIGIVLTQLEERSGSPESESESDEALAGEQSGPARAPLPFSVLRLLVKLLALAVILQAWGVDIAGWLTSDSGHTVAMKAFRIAVILGGAFLIWAVVRSVITEYLTARDSRGNIKFSNRSRTLANIARNVLLALIALFAGATILTELGINTAPLLAGAGVVGLAVGFGSQRLVQDIITGLFILLGDTVRVGDVVDLGGKAGVVEAMSMRAITLRSYEGNVHTIPYSAIETVTNMTKDFSFWVFDIGVAYREDVDQVMQVLRDIDGQLRKEWPYRRLILEPLDIAGLDRFADSAVMIKARIKTRPGEQWRIGREFNRRMKVRFDELGIEIPFPHQTVYFGVDKAGSAPPVFIEQARRALAEKEQDGSPQARAAGE